MKISSKQLCWGIGIAVGLTGLGVLVLRKKDEPVTLSGTPEAITASVSAGATAVSGWLKPVNAKISSKFGYRTDPVKKVSQFHNGIDLPVPLNTKVKSPADGTVANVTSGGDGGNQVIIKHDNGLTTGYAHLNKVQVKKGDKVKAGDIVALSGNTGKSTGPHLHWTLKDKAGKYLDPTKTYMAAA